MKILIGTRNQGKIEGAKQAFEKFYTNVEMIGIPVDSDVSDEPVNDEIYQGASNRVNNLIKYAKENNIGFIALESDGRYIDAVNGKTCIRDAYGKIVNFTGLRNVKGVLTYFKNGIKCNDKTLVKYKNKYYFVKNGTICRARSLVKYKNRY